MLFTGRRVVIIITVDSKNIGHTHDNISSSTTRIIIIINITRKTRRKRYLHNDGDNYRRTRERNKRLIIQLRRY